MEVDIGGQTLGSKMIGKYIYGAHAILLTYDITNFESFQNLEDWKKMVDKNATKDSPPILLLVGSKLDLVHLRTVKHDAHQKFAESFEIESYFVSAKTGDNVAPMFYKLAAELAGVAISKVEIEAITV